jgi:iron-sulfur cluster repair protein YtfE (RIC family)
VTAPALTITNATGKIRPELASFLASLQQGQKLKITQSIRVGARKWTTTTTGVYRCLNYLATGLATHRVPEDDIVVPVLHFTKENEELSSIAVDEHTKVELAQ